MVIFFITLPFFEWRWGIPYIIPAVFPRLNFIFHDEFSSKLNSAQLQKK